MTSPDNDLRPSQNHQREPVLTREQGSAIGVAPPKLSGMKERTKTPRPATGGRIQTAASAQPKNGVRTPKKSTKRRRGLKIALTVFALAVLLIGGACAGGYYFLWDNLLKYEDTIYPGIYIDNKSVAGRTREQLNAAWAADKDAKMHDTPVTLTFATQTFTLPITIRTNEKEQIVRAYEIGRDGGWLERVLRVRTLKEKPVYLTTEMAYDASAVHIYLNEVVKPAIDQPPVDAAFEYDTAKAKVIVTPEKPGRSLNIAPIEESIAKMVDTGTRETIAMVTDEILPEISGADMKAFQTPIAEYSTPIITWRDKNRTDNIRKALSYFNGMVVKPGRSVSFNDVVGPRTLASGFRPAPEYNAIEGVVEGVGGGSCQASTTLYGAVLKAGLAITKRTQHSFVVGYAEPSLDAAVYYGRYDLVFKNNTKNNIFILTKVDQKKVTVRIYGQRENDYTITLEGVKTGTIDKPEPEIIMDIDAKYVVYTDEQQLVDAGKNGAKSTAYRIYTDKNGKEIRSEQLSSDTYKPIRGKLYVGVTERIP